MNAYIEQDYGECYKKLDSPKKWFKEIKLLLMHKADPYVQPFSALHAATYNLNCASNIVKLLLNHRADVNRQDSNGDSAAHMLCRHSTDSKKLGLLLMAGYNLALQNKKGDTIFHVMTQRTDSPFSAMFPCYFFNGQEINNALVMIKTLLLIRKRNKNRIAKPILYLIMDFVYPPKCTSIYTYRDALKIKNNEDKDVYQCAEDTVKCSKKKLADWDQESVSPMKEIWQEYVNKTEKVVELLNLSCNKK